MVAARALAAGEVILAEQPWALVLLPEEQHQRCDFDLSNVTKLLHCRATGLRFASKANQSAAADLYYKAELKAAAVAASRRSGSFSLREWPTTLRLAVRALQLGATHGEQPWLSLESHWDDLSEARQKQLAEHAAKCLDMVAAGLGILPSDHEKCIQQEAQQAFRSIANVSDVAHFLAAVDVNAMTVTDEEQRGIALGLYLQGAIFNHDEEPNCLQSFIGRQLVVRTFRPVKEGEELCITYAELADLSKNRHAFLSERYHFRPRLLPQVENRDAVLRAVLAAPAWHPGPGVGWDSESGVQDWDNKDAADMVQKVSNLRSQAKGATGDGIELLQMAWKEATSGLHFRLGEGHLLRWTLARELMDAYVAAQRWPEALVFARAVCSISREILPLNWPVVSLGLARLAKLELYHGNFDLASSCCEDALYAQGLKPSPSVLCWDDRPTLSRELRQVLAQASAETQAMPRRGGYAEKSQLSERKALGAIANIDLDGLD